MIKKSISFSIKFDAIEKKLWLTMAILLVGNLTAAIMFWITGNVDWLFFLILMTLPAIATTTKSNFCLLVSGLLTSVYMIILLCFSDTIAQKSSAVLIMAFIYACILGTCIIYLSKAMRKHQYSSFVQEGKQSVATGITNALLAARGEENIRQIIIESIAQLSGKPCLFSDIDAEGILVKKCSSPDGLIFYPTELEWISQAFSKATPTGRFFGSSPAAFTNLPLVSENKVLGVVSILFSQNEQIDHNTAIKLDIFIKQAAAALERQRFSDEQSKVIILSHTERIRSDLLRAISHDIRSPLTVIMGACSVLEDSSDSMDSQSKKQLVQDIYEESQWLLHMVENLLSVTQVGENAPKIIKKAELAEEIIGEAVARCSKRFPQANFNVQAPNDPIVVSVDATLIVQVLINLIENAVKYGSADGKIDISVTCEDAFAIFKVRDFGHGVSQEKIEKLFTPSKSLSGDGARGLGIGLSICKSIIVAHNGSIDGKNMKDGGAIFEFRLPKENF